MAAESLTRQQIEDAYRRAMAAGAMEDANAIREILAEMDAQQSPLRDVLIGAASGASGTLSDLMSGFLAVKLGADPHKAMRWTRSRLGIDYKPQTEVGKYAQKMAAGAVGPGSLLGAAGGALAQFAENQGYTDPFTQTAAWMLPAVASGGFRALHTGAPSRDLREVLASTTPEERLAIGLTMKQATERGVPLAIWQAAPEGSALREAGQSIATRHGARKTQEVLRQQAPMGNQSWVRSMTEGDFKAIADEPLSPELAERIVNAIKASGRARHLDPKSMAELRRVSDLFGYYRKTKGGDTTFKPRVKDVGQAISAKGRIKGDLPEFASMRQGTLSAARKAIDDTLEEIPGYREALENYNITKKIAEIVSQDQKLRGRHMALRPEQEGRLTPEATVVYGLATNPWWAAVPFARSLAGKRVMRRLDEAFASNNLAEIRKIAAENPQLEGLIRVLLQAGKGQSVLPDMNLKETILEYLPKGAQ